MNGTLDADDRSDEVAPCRGIHILPTAERLLRDSHPADHLRPRRTRLRLLERERDLLLSVPRLLHVQFFARRPLKAGKLSLKLS